MVPHHNMHCMVSFSPYEAKSQNKFFCLHFRFIRRGGRFEKELAPEYFLSIVEAFHLNRSSSFGLLSRFVKPQFFCADPFPGNSHWLFASMFYEVKNSAVDALQATKSYLVGAVPYVYFRVTRSSPKQKRGHNKVSLSYDLQNGFRLRNNNNNKLTKTNPPNLT